MDTKNLLVWTHPTDRDEAASLLLQGVANVWTDEIPTKMDRSKRVLGAASKGLSRLGDLWDWEHDHWKTGAQLRREFSISRGLARVLSQACRSGISPEIQVAMNTDTTIAVGSWVTHEEILGTGFQLLSSWAGLVV